VPQARWFPFRYGTFSKLLLSALGCGPGRSGIAIGERDVAVRMGWAFEGRAPLTSVQSARPLDGVVISRGAHGWRGDWLVNGAGDGLVEVMLDPPMPAHVIGVPVRARRLRLSVEDPADFVSALETASSG
jgi:hypothetical protein